MVRNVLRLRSGQVAVAMLALLVLLAVLGGFLAPYEPNATVGDPLTGPTGGHWLGTDYLGRDVLSRLLAGSALSLAGALFVAVLAFLLGTVPGVLSIYLGRTFEWISLRLADTLIALPFLVFAVAMTALLGNGVVQALFAVGILLAPVFYRVARSATMGVESSQYVEAAVLAGASTGWVVSKHVLVKVLPPLAISFATTLGMGLVVIASLTFLSIGVTPPTATWGGVLATDLQFIAIRPFAPFVPVVLILVSVLACNLLADAIRDVTGESGRQLLAAREARRSRRRPLVAAPSPAGPPEGDTHV
ncbi:ABC transporter permease [Nocardioides houyundeii]|uniref:ABC transporter permease n=1 Tax=Nocardioides houyundeii TaxID=2045452 RepID=UPI000DF27959|nr:ABC transporter permease [Nocardioides houyundeii]